MAHITPTVGRIVLYRGKDNKVRPAIVTVAWGEYCVNLHVFGQTANDVEDSGSKESVTHADPAIEPGCFPSWHWMPYQLGQAKQAEAKADVPSDLPVPLYQQRVVDEHAELAKKTETLQKFFGTTIFDDLPKAERDRMYRQVVWMEAYRDVLAERIAAF